MNSEARKSKKPSDDILADEEPTLQLEPDGEDEQPAYAGPWREHAAQRSPEHRAPREGETSALHDTLHGTLHETGTDHHDIALDDPEPGDHKGGLGGIGGVGGANGAGGAGAALASAMGSQAGHMSDILRWALDSLHEPAMASADWLARDIDPEQPTAIALLTNPKITLAQVQQAKSVFKTMRIVGEKSADRRVGARMYAAAIAAGLVRHGRLVTRQSDEALRRGFQSLLDDQRMPGQLRDLAGMGLCALNERRYTREEKESDGAGASPARSEAKPPRAKAPGKPAPRNSRNGKR